jgi:hypothetical protein
MMTENEKSTFDIEDVKRFVAHTGIPVFPCQTSPDPTIDKSPWLGCRWTAEATTDTRRIDIEYRRTGTTVWGAYAGAAGYFVIDADLDPTGGKNGVAVIQTIEADHSDAKITDCSTLTIKTPRGGRHYYLRGKADSRNDLYDGVDRKGEGGYVIAPGSVRHDGKKYEKVSLDWRIKAASARQMVDFAGAGAGAVAKKPLERPDDSDVEGSIHDGCRDSELTRWAGLLRGQGLTGDEMDTALQAINDCRCNPPLDPEQVTKIARSIAKKPRGDAWAESRAANEFSAIESARATPEGDAGEWPIRSVDGIDPAAIKPRDWILRDRMIRGFLSVMVAPGGVGKSMLAMLECLAIASGRSDLCGFEVVRGGPVLYLNLEDPREEIERRFIALALLHGVELSALDNIHYMSGRDAPVVLAMEAGGRISVNEDAISRIINFCKTNSGVAVYMDPYIRLHRTPENDNNAGDIVAQTLQRIIDGANVALCVIHHTRKRAPGQSDSNVEDARGAKSVTDAARIVYGMRAMNEKEAAEMGVGVSDAPWYFRIDSTKANLSAPAESACWYHRRSVLLANGESVGAVELAADLSGRAKALADGGTETARAALGMTLDEIFAEKDFPQFVSVTDVIDFVLLKDVSGILGNLGSRKRQRDRVIELLDGNILTTMSKYAYITKSGKQAHFITRI